MTLSTYGRDDFIGGKSVREDAILTADLFKWKRRQFSTSVTYIRREHATSLYLSIFLFLCIYIFN